MSEWYQAPPCGTCKSASCKASELEKKECAIGVTKDQRIAELQALCAKLLRFGHSFRSIGDGFRKMCKEAHSLGVDTPIVFRKEELE